MTKAIIIEDEKNVGTVMSRMIASQHPDIKVEVVCFNVKEAEEALEKFKPRLVFLDIELGKSQTCFDLLKRISPVSFDILFTTAYNRDAMQALKLSAIDFLLKPIDEKELDGAIQKFRHKQSTIDSSRIESLLTAWDNPGSQRNKAYFPQQSGHKPVIIADIIYCESVNGQAQLLLSDETTMPVNLSLKECENMLTPYRFYRIHKSFLINLRHVKRYDKSKNGTTVMSNDATLHVSKSLNEKFLNRLQIA